jgi:hypothetical protein
VGEELGRHPLHGVDRHRDVGPAQEARGVDADEAAVEIHQRPTEKPRGSARSVSM